MSLPIQDNINPGAGWRLPGEFEPQQALIIAWPHHKTDWAGELEAIRHEMTRLIEVALNYVAVVILIDPDDPDPLPESLESHQDIHCIAVPFDDTWCRDFAPITVVGRDQLKFLDFKFNAWGKDYQNQKDDKVTPRLAQSESLMALVGPVIHQPCDFVLEGGAIESNGQGALLINWHCLETRHSSQLRQDIETTLKRYLPVTQILGIDIVPHEGDDTDGHIDTLARFISPQTIVFQGLKDADRHQQLVRQLQALRLETPAGPSVPLKLIELPHSDQASPLPLNYVNFIIINGGVLLPAFGTATDALARDIMQQALPKHETILVDSTMLMTQFGGPHCTTMHIPKLQPNVETAQHG